MKKFLIAMLCSTAFAGSAQAELVSYQLHATVSSLEYFDWIHTSSPKSASTLNLREDTVSLGDTLTATFSYDSATPLSADPNSWRPSFSGPAPSLKISMQFDHRNIAFHSTASSQSTIYSFDNDLFLGDSLRLASWNETPSSSVGAGLSFEGKDETAINGGNLPTDFSKFRPGVFSLGINDYSQLPMNQYSITAKLTSLERINAVPEPESYVMLLAGLGLMAGLGRKRSQA